MKLSEIKSGAISAWEKGILPSIAAAQWALEGGYGTSGLAKPPYNNHFGIKASKDWSGRTVTMYTNEWGAGGMYGINDTFRAYDSMEDSFRDYAAFFSNTPWRKNNYRHVVGEKNYVTAAHAIKDAGYATDPNYPSKLINIIEQNKLYEWDKEVFEGKQNQNDNGETPLPQPEPFVPSTVSIAVNTDKTVGGDLTSAGNSEAKKLNVTLIGDETALSLVNYFYKRFNRVNAVTSAGKTLTQIATEVSNLSRSKSLHEYVIIVSGTHGTVDRATVESIAEGASNSKVLFVDTSAEVSNKAIITQEFYAVSTKYKNAYYIDWSKYSRPFITALYNSRTILNLEGSKTLANYIAQAVYESSSGSFEGRTAQWTSKRYYGVEKVDYNEGGLYSPKGQSVIYNPESNQQWGFRDSDGKAQWIDGLVEVSGEKDEKVLMNAAVEYMKQHSVPAVQYTVNLSDISSDLSIGDRGVFVDRSYNPPLVIEATVIEITTSDTDLTSNNVTIGNVVELFPTENQEVLVLQQKLEKVREEALNEYKNNVPIELKIDSISGFEFTEGIEQLRIFAVPNQGGLQVDIPLSYRWERISDDKESDNTYNDILNRSVQSAATTVHKADLINGKATLIVRAYNEKGELVAVNGANLTIPEQGKSAYQVALDNGFRGTVQQWLESLKGAKGEQGIPGTKGNDGRTQYTYVAYANGTQGEQFSVTDSTGRAYMGTAVGFEVNKPTDYRRYSWIKVKADESYTWIVYADDSTGKGLSSSKTGKKYRGTAYNKATSSFSSNPLDYHWELLDVEKELENKAGQKETSEYLNNIRGEIQKTQQQQEALATKQMITELMQNLNALRTAQGKDRADSEKKISESLTKLAQIENDLGDMAVRWKFLDLMFQVTNEGLVMGNKSKGTYMRLDDNRLGFFNNGQEIAHFSGNMLHISQAVFVEQIQVSEWLIGGYENDRQILVFRHVGRVN